MKTVINTIKQSHKYLKYLEENYNSTVLYINEFEDEEVKNSKLEITLKDYQHNMKVVQDTISGTCKHELIISAHGSMITGKSRNHKPNPNHICHYCVACGKWLREDEVMPWAYRLDFFGHPDALLVGNINSSAIVDYLQDYALKEFKENPYYTIKEFSEKIENNKENITLPEKYIRRSKTKK